LSSPHDDSAIYALHKAEAAHMNMPFGQSHDRASMIERVSLLSEARKVSDETFAIGERLDDDGAFPEAGIVQLHLGGLLAAPLPLSFGGVGISSEELCPILRAVGAGSLPLGRLYEGHVNAIGLVLRYGRRDQIEFVAGEVLAGGLLGVWNTDDANGLKLICEDGRYTLQGRKILASGAGYIRRPLITATDEYKNRVMVMPKVELGSRTDLSKWSPHGMRASATGSVDFSGLSVLSSELIGSAGDYEREPYFSGGAWRFAAVHQGGMERLFDLLRTHLRRTGRGENAHQAARLGEAGIAIETARLWVERAAAVADETQGTRPEDLIVAYVNLARLAVERAGLSVMELVHRSVGLQGFMRPHPIERFSRDLATYLRQPGPDLALTNAAAWILRNDRRASDLWS
jgi:alkylation response protein AidB-like acyl-CoA dehydrogenase